jgi:tripartite-type tricarboxylate transporter receptor subunit TctC
LSRLFESIRLSSATLSRSRSMRCNGLTNGRAAGSCWTRLLHHSISLIRTYRSKLARRRGNLFGRLKCRRCALFATTSILATALATVTSADENFYSGKTIQILVGFTAGGGFDLYARTLARYMGRHIPGNPTLVVQNMPGAGSLRAANYLYNAAPTDGTAIAEFAPGVVVAPLLGTGEGTYFDAPKFTWLGSISQDTSICAFNKSSGIGSWQDMQTKPSTVGASGGGAESDVFPTVLHRLFNLPLRIVDGYPGSNEIILAMQRHEVDGRCGWSWASLVSRNASLLDNKEIDITLQIGLKKDKALQDIPLVMDLTNDPLRKAALKLIISRQAIARPFAAPPGIPVDRAQLLRQAFDATMKDPEFLDEAKTLNLDIDPIGGADVQALLKEIYASPRDVVDLASQLTQKSGQ